MKRYRQGFSLLELVVVISIISVLLVVAIDRLLALQVEAERVAMETLVGTLRSAIGLKVAERIVKHDRAGIRALVGSNPMDRLAELPPNYLGELDNPDPHRIEAGNWYFNRRSQALVYRVRNTGYFSGGLPEPPRARFVIRLVYTDRNKNGRFDIGIDMDEGVSLSVVEPYRWIGQE